MTEELVRGDMAREITTNYVCRQQNNGKNCKYEQVCCRISICLHLLNLENRMLPEYCMINLSAR